jgi:hypothetical protein
MWHVLIKLLVFVCLIFSPSVLHSSPFLLNYQIHSAKAVRHNKSVRSSNRSNSLFVWLVADGWCWFVLREKYCWLVVGGWFVLREKYCWLVADKPNEQGQLKCPLRRNVRSSNIHSHDAGPKHTTHKQSSIWDWQPALIMRACQTLSSQTILRALKCCQSTTGMA